MDTVTATEALARTPDDPWRTFDRWTSNLFLFLAVLGLVAGVTVAGQVGGGNPALSVLGLLMTVSVGGLVPEEVPAIVVLATVAIIAMWSAVVYVGAVGLDRRLPWARQTAWGLLVVLIASGLVGAVEELANGRIPIPLGVIAGAVVLSHKPGPLPAIHGRDRGMAVGLSAAYLAASLGVGAPAWLATSSDSPLTVGSEALDLRLVVVCPSVAGGGFTKPVPVAVSWSWRAREPLAAGTDGLGVAWAHSGDALAFDAQSITQSDPVWPGGGSLSAGVIQDAMSGAANLTWGIDLNRGGLTDTGVGFTLLPPYDGAGAGGVHGWLTVWAVYAHLDRWTVRQETTCNW